MREFKDNLFSNPFCSDKYYYPNEVCFYSGMDNLIGIIASVPLQLFFSLYMVYNILLVFYGTLAAFFMWKLLEYFKPSKYSFWFALLYGINPYFFMHTFGHFNLLPIFVIPMTILFTFKFLNKINRKNSIILTFSLIITLYSCLYYFLFSAIFIFVAFLVYLSSKTKQKSLKIIKSSQISIILFFFVSLPYVIKHLYNMGNSGATVEGVEYFAPDLLGVLVPNKFFLIFKLLSENIQKSILHFYQILFNSNTVESIVYLGLLLFFALYFIYQNIKTKNNNLKIMITEFFVFIILFIGPLIRFNNNIEFFGIKLYMPFYLLKNTPFYTLFNVHTRFYIVLLIISILFSYLLIIEIKNKKLTIALISILLLSFFMTYDLTQRPDYSYENLFDNDVIINVPLSLNDNGLIYKYGMVHNQPMVDGYISHTMKPFKYTSKFIFDPVYSKFHPLFNSNISLDPNVEYYITCGLIKKNVTKMIYRKNSNYNEQIWRDHYTNIFENNKIIIFDIVKGNIDNCK